MTAQRKVFFHTLGCKLNFSETSTLAREFEAGGYLRAPSPREADVCVINSCSVTEQSDKKCRNLIRRMNRENPSAIIAVTGCYAQLKPEEIAEIEGVDIVLGNNGKGELFEKVSRIAAKGRHGVYSCATEELTGFFAAFSGGDRTRAFLKVQDGCDYKCSYCTIHNARGPSRNLPIDEILSEARKIAAAGQKEIVITGINTGDFGRTTGEGFSDLLRELNGIEGIERYRISSIEPNLLIDEIIDLCASLPKFQHHFHIPLQSGSGEVLRRMRRRYTPAAFSSRIEAVRRRMPDTFFGIDVIVGFPGETEENFRETYQLLERLRPAYLHIFPYSVRANTPAADFPDKVPDGIKAERAARLGELSARLHREFYEANRGATAQVLFESARKGGMMYGFTGNYIKVGVPYDRALVNRTAAVRLTEIDGEGNMSAEIL